MNSTWSWRREAQTSKPVVPPSPLAGEGWGEGAASELLSVREGSVFPYLAKPQQSHHFRDSGNPAPLVPLTEVATLNPRGFDERPADDDLVSFIPMKAVEEESGRLSATETKRWGDVKKGYTLFQNSDVIFAKITPCMENGKYALATGLHGGRAAGSTEFHVFRPKPELDSKYLLHFLFTPELRSRARMNMKGAAGQLRVPTQFFNDVQIPLPALEEQRRIVAKLETQLTRLDASVTALKRVQAHLKRYRASVLKAACEGRLVPTEAELTCGEGGGFESGSELLCRIQRERSTDIVRKKRKPKEADEQVEIRLPHVPEGWAWATVEELAALMPNSITDGPFGSNLKTEHYVDEGPRVIRLQNIGDGVFMDERAHITEAHFQRLAKHRVFAGDVVIAAMGEGPPRACIVPDWLGPAIVKADCVRFQPDARLSAKYLNYALNAEPTRVRTKSIVHGVGRPRLNLGEIRSISLPLPPEMEQRRIVAEVDRRLSVTEELQSAIAANLKRAELLRRSILQQAFQQTC